VPHVLGSVFRVHTTRQRPVRVEVASHQVARRLEAVVVLHRVRRSRETSVGFEPGAKTAP
jgi:hypothetical protein